MGCENVCVYMSYDSDDNEFYSESIRRARKSYQCCECRRTIVPGQPYQYVSAKSDGAVWSKRTCPECAEIRRVFCCEGWVFGDLWKTVEESLFDMWKTTSPIECLARLESVEARNLMRERYVAWRDDE